jgi:hypothetical protein
MKNPSENDLGEESNKNMKNASEKNEADYRLNASKTGLNLARNIIPGVRFRNLLLFRIVSFSWVVEKPTSTNPREKSARTLL